MTGAESQDVIVAPKAGADFAVVSAGGGYLIVASDPITGISSNIGRYAVSVSANDVATSGNRPRFLETVILLPEGSSEALLAEISGQLHETARNLGLSIVGGHTEVTPGLKRPIVVSTVFCVVKEYVTSGGALAGDAILMTKTAGLEGTAAIADESKALRVKVPRTTAVEALRLRDDLGVVEEAVAAFNTGSVHAMHDCTEGGVLGGVYEMSLASGVGFELLEGAVPLAEATRDICARLSLDPLRLIGSGSLLIAVDQEDKGKVMSAVKDLCRITEIGRFTPSGRHLKKKDGKTVEVKAAPEDELWRVLRRRR
jgi:hydrogenase expression/formation protein HypE